MEFTLDQICSAVGGELKGDANTVVRSLKSLLDCDAESLSFLQDPKFLPALEDCSAGALLIRREHAERYSGNVIIVDNPYMAFAQVSHLFDPEPQQAEEIHPSAVVHESVVLGAQVAIGANAVVEEGSILGDRVVIGPGAVVGKGVVIGDDSHIYANVTLYYGVRIGQRCILHSGCVIGAHGFGYANQAGIWHKIAQIGAVVLDDDVEVGANATIDRGAIGDTHIKTGVKVDNLVMLGHNVTVGQHTAFASQVGVSGSTNIGAHSMIGGQSGFAGHLDIADGCMFSGQSMVTKSITKPGAYSSGVPVQPSADWRKWVARVRRIDDLHTRVKALEKKADPES